MIIQKYKIEKLKKLIFIFGAIHLFVILGSTFFPGHQPVNRFKGNFFVALASPPKPFNNILEGKKEKFESVRPWKVLQSTGKPGKKKNIILIIVETLSATVPSNVMPRLQEIRSQSISYNQHYTSWPFSSKSLFSLLCAQPPIPSNLIELRVGGNISCQNWIGDLSQNKGYRSLISYTGDLSYDNMKNFFQKLGVKESIDRNDLNVSNKYRKNNLSIDDQSMIDHFEKWIQKDNTPFVSVFITMNSHFPFWDPDEENRHRDPYLNAMSYQDKMIGKFFDLIKHHKLLDDTIFVVTGDHGRRETIGSTIIPASMFHVPLVVFNSDAIGEINDPTSHYEIGSELVKLATDKDFGFEDFNLKSKKDVVLYFETNELLISLLSKDGQKIIFPSGKIMSQPYNWVRSESTVCNQYTECPDDYNLFYSMINNLDNLYP